MANINMLDAILLGIIILSSLFGLWRGLIRGVFGIVSLVLSFLVAKNYGDCLKPAMDSLLDYPAFNLALSYVLVFMLALLIFAALTSLLHKIVNHVDLGILDKFSGMVFGLIRGGVIALAILFLLSALSWQNSPWWQNSRGVMIFGHLLQTALTFESLAKYDHYWQFDSDHRPTFDLPSRALTDNVLSATDRDES